MVKQIRNSLRKNSLARHLMIRLFPPIALLVLLDLAVTWVLTSRMHLEDWLLRDIFWTMLLSQLLWVALFGWVLIAGLKSGLRAVERLGQDIQTQDPESLQPLSAADLPAELRPLVDQFNQLLVRLDQSVAAQKRFIAHAAHQLRTPLSALRLESELMLTKPLPEDLREQAQRIKQSTERMIRLGQQLLVLARADSAASPQDCFVRLDLCEWARTSGAEWLAATYQHGLRLELSAPEQPVWVDADPLLLDELLGNLIDNALRYAQAQERITLRVSANPPTLSVEDDGVGIGLNQASQLFEAFYRGTDSSQSDGSGLGLAIVREIALAHGAGWNLISRPHFKGTRISVVFPGPRRGTGFRRRFPVIEPGMESERTQ
ncbi:HAMP domain-containing sensor histidine kinase [Paenalcaligenes sp.]|uniref:sensor histidine kinase n=1 Tax=Paenalcaligenes sp. TaxID=1966342 RepID=UPI002626745F|nr:HAMP domain-containing sensor histidine kinase [Paenalcaligenes sp.]